MHPPIRVIMPPAQLSPELAADMVGRIFPIRQEFIDQDWSFGATCHVLHPHDVQNILTAAIGVERATRHNLIFMHARYIAIPKSCCVVVETETTAVATR